jgi:hypothetical protein
MESGDDDEFHAKRSRFIDNIMTTTGGEMKQASSVQMSPSTIIYNEREIDDTLITQRNDEDDAFFEHTKRDAIILQQVCIDLFTYCTINCCRSVLIPRRISKHGCSRYHRRAPASPIGQWCRRKWCSNRTNCYAHVPGHIQ